MAEQSKEQPKKERVKVPRTTPASGWWAVYAVRGEDGRPEIEQESVSEFAVLEDEEGNRFVSGVREDGELSALREDFVGHFSARNRWRIRESAERFVRARAQERGEVI